MGSVLHHLRTASVRTLGEVLLIVCFCVPRSQPDPAGLLFFCTLTVQLLPMQGIYSSVFSRLAVQRQHFGWGCRIGVIIFNFIHRFPL